MKSLSTQNCSDFDVVIVDDGSISNLQPTIDEYSDELDIQYYWKENSGPGLSRNFGMSKAKGDYFIFLDSDTIVPPNYVCSVIEELNHEYVDFFGGSDASHETFSSLQKAISFSMTSFLTTGGIRGGKNKVEKFQPRSFNMGLSREAYESSKGFSDLRVGEDPDLTLTLWEKGFNSRWFSDTFVYHKRRTSLSEFAKQVKSFGIARPILNQRHPKYRSLAFWFPSVFIVGFFLAILVVFFGIWEVLMIYIIYFAIIFITAAVQNKSIIVGFLSCLTTFIQFEMYGSGFLKAQFKLNVLNQKPKEAFPNHFYNN